MKMRLEMELAGYTYEKLSELSGVSAEVIRKLFSGEMDSPTYELLNALENVLRPGTVPDSIRESGAEYVVKKEGYTLEDYYMLPDDLRAELIDGAFYVMEAPSVLHQMVSREILVSLCNFIREKKEGCEVFAAPVDVQLDCDDKTMVEPDVLVVCDLDKLIKRCVYGAPDFIVEVLSDSTRKKDMTVKLKKYKEAGVREYWMIDMENGKVITCFFEKSEMPVLYGMEETVPVLIFGGELEIDFQKISQTLEKI